MADDAIKLCCVFAFVMGEYLCNCYTGIVIADSFGDASEKVEGSYMCFKKRLSAFTRKSHHEHSIRMNHTHYEKYDLF